VNLAAQSLSIAAFLMLTAFPAAAADGEARPPLEDNSFLIEEAYNQEAGVVQQYGTYLRGRRGGWVAAFTQEWPVPGQAHQLSYTLTYGQGGPGGERGLGDVLVNYRYQAVYQEDRLAFAPRLSVVIAGSQADSGASYRGVGPQGMLPVSITLTPWLVSHSNLGLSWIPAGRDGDATARFLVLTLGQSFVWLPHPRFNVLLETLWLNTDVRTGGTSRRDQALLVSPGIRWGLDLPHDVQLVLGLAAPLGVGPSAGERSVLLYLSVEAPFWTPAATRP
jgi:hypothetical protein